MEGERIDMQGDSLSMKGESVNMEGALLSISRLTDNSQASTRSRRLSASVKVPLLTEELSGSGFFLAFI